MRSADSYPFSPERKITVLADSVNGERMLFPNDLAILFQSYDKARIVRLAKQTESKTQETLNNA